MADEQPVAPPATPAPEPAPAAPAPAPVVDPAPAAPEPPATPEPAPAAPEPPVAAAAEPAAPAREPSLLEAAQPPPTEPAKAPDPAKPAEPPVADPAKKPDAPEPEKPVEAPKEGEQPKTEEVVAEPPPVPPVEYKYELPPSLTMDDAQRGEFHGALDKYRANPADPSPLLEQGVKMMQAYDQVVSQRQVDAWHGTLKGWRDEVLADPVLGGAGHQTAMSKIALVRNHFMSDHAPGTPEFAADTAAFNHMLDSTGVGNHPVMLRFLHRMLPYVNEPPMPSHGDNPKPPAEKGTGGNPLHDNPRSRQLNGGGR